MKHKVELKKLLICCFLVIIIFNIGFMILNHYEYKIYTENFNNKLNTIILEVNNNYPDVDKNKLVQILNSKEVDNNEFLLKKYGIDLKKDSLVLINDEYFNKFLKLNIAVMLGLSILLMILFLRYNHSKSKKINEITKYIEEINKRNYKLYIEDNTEDELSILKNELYKTTVMLKEMAENSLADKISLKESLSDISHQLKTPLTSIIVMLDNILDDKNMESEVKEDFIKDIKREVTNINFLCLSLLKLSKFDVNAIKFINKEEFIKDILEESVKNISALCDLKNINIYINGNKDIKINCDLKWQVEAITNILKNCIEHSEPNSNIKIHYEKNNMYSLIKIKDEGSGISPKDLPHIFERFYKASNSSSESIGIGLALTKSIIESNNGYITAESELGKGTTFIIKYFN